jgi:hypothetical protein
MHIFRHPPTLIPFLSAPPLASEACPPQEGGQFDRLKNLTKKGLSTVVRPGVEIQQPHFMKFHTRLKC